MNLALNGNLTGATTLLLKKANRASQTWFDAVHTNLSFQKKAAAQEYKLASTALGHARNLLVALCCASTILATALVWRTLHRTPDPLEIEQAHAAVPAQQAGHQEAMARGSHLLRLNG